MNIGDFMDLETLVSNALNDTTLVKISDAIYLTKYQIAVLERYHIEYTTCNDIKEILFLIDDYLESEYEEDLDDVAKSLQEFSYYNYTNK